MSMATLERSILAELRVLTGRPKLRLKDIAEWSTSEETVRKGATEAEEVVALKSMKVWAAVAKAAPKK